MVLWYSPTMALLYLSQNVFRRKNISDQLTGIFFTRHEKYEIFRAWLCLCILAKSLLLICCYSVCESFSLFSCGMASRLSEGLFPWPWPSSPPPTPSSASWTPSPSSHMMQTPPLPGTLSLPWGWSAQGRTTPGSPDYSATWHSSTTRSHRTCSWSALHR